MIEAIPGDRQVTGGADKNYLTHFLTHQDRNQHFRILAKILNSLD
jgi:hypothetical protein